MELQNSAWLSHFAGYVLLRKSCYSLSLSFPRRCYGALLLTCEASAFRYSRSQSHTAVELGDYLFLFMYSFSSASLSLSLCLCIRVNYEERVQQKQQLVSKRGEYSPPTFLWHQPNAKK